MSTIRTESVDERLLKSIDGFPKSYALIPTSALTRSAIVFVHGFAGSPTGTWCDFQGLSSRYAKEYPWWRDAALFFYSYDSMRSPIYYNAVRLRSFLEYILSVRVDFHHNANDPGPSMNDENPWKYENLLLVGHSEGAVVIRRMVLNAIEALTRHGREQNLDEVKLREWVNQGAHGSLILRARLRLFAPACAGTNFSGVVGFVGNLSHFFSALASSSLVRNELLRGSPVLCSLQTGTDLAYRDHPNIHALTAKILFGSNDQIVYTDKYGCDEIIEPFAEGHDHFSVCKPKHTYMRPLEFVKP
jgi:hypothetical protein